MAAHNVRTAIPVITNAAAPTFDTDEVSGIISILDTALEAYHKLKPLREKLGRYTSANRLVAFFAKHHPHAEYAMTLWASANQLEVKRHASYYTEDNTQIRVLEVLVGADTLVTLQWDREPIPVSPSEVVASLREWRPSDGAHWTVEHTSALDGANNEVITTLATTKD